MPTSPITAATSTSSSASDTQNRIPMQVLGQNDFLKLLVAQLSAQDPLNPQKDTEFIAQMAQFSALEQTKAMQFDIAQLTAQQYFVQANSLIGREVNLQTGPDQFVHGVVSAVRIEAGMPMIVVNDQSYDMSSLLSVSMAQPQPAPATEMTSARALSLP